METYNDIEIVATIVLIIWSIGLGWASWQIQVKTLELRAERAEVRRWVRLKGLWERQNGRWR
jgi:hypothetical protein